MGGGAPLGVGTVKAGGEKQRMKKQVGRKGSGQLGCWPPHPARAERTSPDPMAAQMASCCLGHSLGLGIWGSEVTAQGTAQIEEAWPVLPLSWWLRDPVLAQS